jgi:hypothetical protein
MRRKERREKSTRITRNFNFRVDQLCIFYDELIYPNTFGFIHIYVRAWEVLRTDFSLITVNIINTNAIFFPPSHLPSLRLSLHLTHEVMYGVASNAAE